MPLAIVTESPLPSASSTRTGMIVGAVRQAGQPDPVVRRLGDHPGHERAVALAIERVRVVRHEVVGGDELGAGKVGRLPETLPVAIRDPGVEHRHRHAPARPAGARRTCAPRPRVRSPRPRAGSSTGASASPGCGGSRRGRRESSCRPDGRCSPARRTARRAGGAGARWPARCSGRAGASRSGAVGAMRAAPAAAWPLTRLEWRAPT